MPRLNYGIFIDIRLETCPVAESCQGDSMHSQSTANTIPFKDICY